MKKNHISLLLFRTKGNITLGNNKISKFLSVFVAL